MIFSPENGDIGFGYILEDETEKLQISLDYQLLF